ncbi:MAG: Gfo/Idh/MocA family oxidoreductase [Lactobacillus sp.]|uniref:Gfo/Idh/MocA family protein n=1 Tax=Bombilactobacillus bombi TaxID=1303590 RepID=UPI0035E7A6C4|nr:Gfo/Idh/MocA family oxidoreductase [Lactobacillus sp.]
MLRFGVIGCGYISHVHVNDIVNNLHGAKVTAIYDINKSAAEQMIDEFDLGIEPSKSIDELINSSEVDSVLVFSKNDTHTEPILKALAIDKPVFTEKPLATTTEEAKQIVDAEVKKGKRMIQVGYMRRYDPYYQELKQTIDNGEIGTPLMGYCRHFAPAPTTNDFQTSDVINDSFVHEISVVSWLFNDDYKSVQVQYARPNSTNTAAGLKEPQVATLKLKNGAIVNTYLDINSHYGYEVKCQVIGETGIAELPDMPSTRVHKDEKIYNSVPLESGGRFEKAFQLEFQDFIDRVSAGKEPTGPSAWTGYTVTFTANKALESLKNGQIVDLEFGQKPDLYK